VPGEVLDLKIGMHGYHAASSPSKLGRLDCDRIGLVFVMEPGR